MRKKIVEIIKEIGALSWNPLSLGDKKIQEQRRIIYAAQILSLIAERIEKGLLTDEDIQKLIEGDDMLKYGRDMGFIDDYKEETKALLQAQLDKILSLLKE